jgi:hypothetical protein
MTNHIDGICQKCKPVKSAELKNRTKEQILDRNGFDFDAFKFENEYSAKNLLNAMEEYHKINSQSEPINQKLLHALKESVNIIREWTRLGVSCKTEKETWSIYVDSEYRMKMINEAIQQAEQLK